MFFIQLFSGLFYTKNWILATVAQGIAYILITITTFVYYFKTMDHAQLIGMEINLNISLFISSFIYYFAEQHQREIVYINFQLDHVI